MLRRFDCLILATVLSTCNGVARDGAAARDPPLPHTRGKRLHGACVANCDHKRGVSSRLRPPRFALPSPSPAGRRERRVPARAGRFMGRLFKHPLCRLASAGACGSRSAGCAAPARTVPGRPREGFPRGTGATALAGAPARAAGPVPPYPRSAALLFQTLGHAQVGEDLGIDFFLGVQILAERG